MKRRDLLRLGATVSAGAAAGLLQGPLPGASRRATPVPGMTPASKASEGIRARNIIFFAYDGTGYEDLATASFFARSLGRSPLHFENLLGMGRSGLMRPESLTSVVTDSAAATTAWATGQRVVNGALSMHIDERELVPILHLAKDRGMATGLVTSTRITHATPAGWIARVPSRGMEDEIAAQYLDFEPDILMGGGAGRFQAEMRSDGRDLLGEFRQAGYEVLRTPAELAASTGDRVLGLFSEGTRHLPFEVDRVNRGVESPSLADLTFSALQRLEGAGRGFVLQVEAGRIDHANHHNDPAGMVGDWMAAEEALEVVLRHVARNPDTLLIAVPDHDTGGGVTYGIGRRYTHSTPALASLHRRQASLEWLLRDGLPRNPDPTTVAAGVEEYLGLPLASRRAEQISAVLAGERPEEWDWGHPNAQGSRNNRVGHLLSISDETPPVQRANINFATGAHTGGFVPLVLHGAGATQGNLGVIDNTELFRIMTDALGFRYENPAMDPRAAREAETSD
ncbi:MAG: alkaline phosphatase [Gemmatimonadales bacterium]|nr:MAG: alkaline phosphatase [Gemmatimonadales bacterium]